MSRPLRVGILVDSLIQPAWVRKILDDIRGSSSAELVLVIRNGPYREPPLSELLRTYRHQLLPLLYDRLDARLVRHRRQPDAFERRGIEPLIAGLPILDIHTIRKKYSDSFPDDDVERVLGHDLDVALRFGFRILRGRALEIARYGVWSYHHGDNREIRGGPNSFWEVMQARPVTGAILQVLSADLDNGRVIARTHSATNPLSLSLNRNRHYWKSAALVRRTLHDLHERGPAGLDEDRQAGVFRPYDERIYRRPSNVEAIPILARFGARLIGHAATRLVAKEQWLIAYRFSRGAAEENPAFHRFRRLPPPAGAQWSQPFPIALDGTHYLLYTERPSSSAYSRIAAVELTEAGPAGRPVVVLEAGHDLAYPFVFRWQDQLYLLPDSGPGRDLTLYRCIKAPDAWEVANVLLSGVRAAHATLAEHAGGWWMFVVLAEPGAALTDELHLFRADSPLGPWQPHPRNPVKSDARSARPAGRLFTWRGQLYRPAQDCSVREGSAIVINRVDELSPERYVETEVSRIRPRWHRGLVANGVFNTADGLLCIDGLARQLPF